MDNNTNHTAEASNMFPENQTTIVAAPAKASVEEMKQIWEKHFKAKEYCLAENAALYNNGGFNRKNHGKIILR